MPELTTEQVANWRKALSITLGPYALIMPEADVRKLHAKMQIDIHDIATATIEEAKKEAEPEVDEGAARYWRKKLEAR